MALHVEFKEHKTTKYSCTDYTFLDRHTSEEIAFGSYNGEGDFELISLRDGDINKFVSAAVAYVHLQNGLSHEYGY